MLLADEITLQVGHETIRLRASLRASVRLHRRFQGFDKIVSAIADGNISVMAAVIAESATERTDLADLLDSGGALSVRIVVDHLVGPLIAHVGALAGFDADATDNQKQTGKLITFEEYHTRLFGLATGWLGWSPNAAWNATPAEITEAYKGRVAMLAAVFGGAKAEDDRDPESAEDTRRRLNAIGDLSNVHMVA